MKPVSEFIKASWTCAARGNMVSIMSYRIRQTLSDNTFLLCYLSALPGCPKGMTYWTILTALWALSQARVCHFYGWIAFFDKFFPSGLVYLPEDETSRMADVCQRLKASPYPIKSIPTNP